MLSYDQLLKSLPKGLFQKFEDLSLEKVKSLYVDFGVFDKINQKKIIHIAGTNGKGSTSKMIFSCLKAAGKKVGVFTSPHLVTIRERAETHEGQISKEDFTAIGNNILDFTKELSYFEFCLLFALKHFLDKDCEYIILETGLGGTYDATNIFDSDITCITSISLDHQKILGYSIEEISANKAGIIKPNVPLFLNFRNNVIENKVLEENAQIYFVDNYFETNLHGEHQRKNAGLAYSICSYLGVDEKFINTGLKNVRINGRIEYLSHNLIIDGSHNIDSLKKLFEYLEQQNSFESIVFYFSVKKGNSINMIIENIGDREHYFIKVENEMLTDYRGIIIPNKSPEDIVKKSQKENKKLHVVLGSLYVLQYFIDNKCLAKKLD